MKPRIEHCYGLANRVTAMANGLSRFAEIEFPWRENWHCPAGWREIFPRGVAGVEFIDGTQPAFSTRWDGKLCGTWDAAGDRAAANEAYGTIISAMAGAAWMEPELAVCARFFRPHSAPPEALVETIVATAREMELASVYVLADSRREWLANELVARGITGMFPRSAELVNDRGRTVEQTLEFLSDWKTMLRARRLVLLTDRTDLYHPARASGVEITVAAEGD